MVNIQTLVCESPHLFLSTVFVKNTVILHVIHFREILFTYCEEFILQTGIPAHKEQLVVLIVIQDKNSVARLHTWIHEMVICVNKYHLCVLHGSFYREVPVCIGLSFDG